MSSKNYNSVYDIDVKDINTKNDLISLLAPYISASNTIMISKIAVDIGQKKEDPVLLLTAAESVADYVFLPELAVTLLEKALLFFPKLGISHQLDLLRAEVEIRLASQFMMLGQEKESLTLYMKVAQNHKELKLNVGESLTGMLLQVGYPELALKIARAWISDGTVSGIIYNNMGGALRMLNHSQESIQAYDRALEMLPRNRSIAFAYGLSLLKSGFYKQGLKYFVDHEPYVVDPSWWFVRDITRLKPDDDIRNKDILLFQEQGLGDTLQFIRFVPQLLKRGAKITLAVPIALKSLLAFSFPEVDILLCGDLGKSSPEQYKYDFACPITELPYICNVESDKDIPINIPYLYATEEGVKRFSDLIDAILPERSLDASGNRPLRVGIIWGGDRRLKATDVASDKRRSTTFNDMIKALSPVEADIFNLQYDKKRMELVTTKDLLQPVYDLMDNVHNMADTAALMQNLDLIISVDTSPLHLSAALGRPTWLVNRRDSCWRWGEDGEKSVWYPTLRIFRSQEKSFVPVLERVGKELRALVSSRKRE
ncbi:tetratricopeptide repeat-containing glycosyltransferase family protein [Acetobacteraceae bacterium ESL0709]|nr:tetratricopeptide repeat-containing glycosyltransferase family protein [Acetobacteraceae bacterium ESL0697]MDF7679011.1 tetratricopeptide repeat-containing glycosyltransferase family protein [Acetobacteraceae bacterium ESL0709]